MPIRILDPIVASQIAAGEVVERPASVVKELVENAIDAGARRVSVEVRGGGVTELRIQDDGSGIPADEVELAFQRHATSKLASAEDLFAIATLGFRGEALPSIAAVAQVTCITRTASAPAAAELRVAGGEIQSRTTIGAPVGTTFIIRNLFYNIPVRREFLRSPGAEVSAISAVMTQYALAYPSIRFSLVVDGKPRLQTSGSGHLPDVLLSIYGLEVARAMLPLNFQDGGSLTGITARGLVSPPTLSRGSRDAMHLSVNGRAVAPRGQVAQILDDAYHTLLMKGRFPYIIMAIGVHPATVDVNVHPTKSEVKFRDPERIRAVLARAIRGIVQDSVVVQGWDGTSIPRDPETEPEWVEAEDLSIAEPQSRGAAEPISDTRQGDQGVAEPQNRRTAEPTADHRPPTTTQQQGATKSDGTEYGIRNTEAARPPLFQLPSRARPVEPAPIPPAPQIREQHGIWEPADEATSHQPPATSQQRPAAEADTGQPSSTVQRPSSGGLPRLRALSQLARMYLLAEGPEGDLYLIDQHAAHERITFERLMAQRGAGAIESQRLLIPQVVLLAPAAQAMLLEAAEELGTWGFELEEAERGVRVRAMPASVALEELKPALLEVTDHLSGAGGSTPHAWREALLVTLSCHTSIRTGHPLTSAEQQALIDQLSQCQGPRTCPHGRPTVIIMTKQQLTRQFGRLGA